MIQHDRRKPAGVVQHASDCDRVGTLPGVQHLKSLSDPLQSSIYVHAWIASKAYSAAVHVDSRQLALKCLVLR